jgi:hypothetical protein
MAQQTVARECKGIFLVCTRSGLRCGAAGLLVPKAAF